MTARPPIKTIPNVQDADLDIVCKQLEEDGYIPIQRKKEEVWDEATKKNVRIWTIKAKLNEPPAKPGRQLV